ncbi:MAG: flagellar basal body rod protein FlgC [Planctomycetes bacterium]|nr:flagellar basal body rod protein FlgC [Planctomycetota bacterium]
MTTMQDPMQGVFRGFDIASSGLRAGLQRAEIVAANLGNMHRTGNAEHEPWRRKTVVFEELLEEARSGELDGDAVAKLASGVQVAQVVEDQTPFPVFYQPGHPDADATGKVLGSNVDLFQELVDMSVIERGFDANLTALRTYRGMLQNTITNLSR